MKEKSKGAITLLTIRNCCYMTQNSVAKDIGISTETLARWENGKTVPRGKFISNINSFIDSIPTSIRKHHNINHLSRLDFYIY